MVVNEEGNEALRNRTSDLERVGRVSRKVGVGWPREAHKGSNDDENGGERKEKGELDKEREESNWDNKTHRNTKSPNSLERWSCSRVSSKHPVSKEGGE